MPTSNEMRENVRVSAIELDSKIPGWYNDIDTELLQMDSFSLCICGQLNIEGYNPDREYSEYASKEISCSYMKGFFVEMYLDCIDFDRRTMNEVTLKEWWIEEIRNRL